MLNVLNLFLYLYENVWHNCREFEQIILAVKLPASYLKDFF